MKLLILGSTGATGQQLLAQSLELGHHVTVFVRDASKVNLVHERLRVVIGNDIANLPALASAVRGQDVVISALGVGKSFHAADVIARGVHAIVPTMEREGPRRLIFTSALDWTIVQPTRLTNGPRTGRYYVGERLPVPSAPPLSRADAAAFILAQVEDRTHERKSVVICG